MFKLLNARFARYIPPFGEIKSIKNLEYLIAFLMVFLGVALRFFPHSPNFTALGAISLFAGAYLSRKIALLLPLFAMVISDIFIGYYESGLMIVVYGSFLIYVVLGFYLRKRKKWYTILGSSVLGAAIFFLLTNLAVWAFTAWYPKTLPGLIECYLMGLPFLKNTVLGDLFYASIFFGVYEMAVFWLRKKMAVEKINPVLSR